jgi:hypothetical protein
MTKSEFFKLYNEVKQNLYWVDAMQNADIAIHIQKKYKFIFLTETELKAKIENLKKFDVNLLWDKNFMGLGRNDSICAVASEPDSFLRKLRDNF